MNDQVKFIVERLNREPFKKNLNFINFDSLSGNNLLQLLNDIFAEIDPKQKLDIRNEEPDQTAIRMLNLLKVLKYKPPDENLQSFRQGVVVGDKIVIYPIMRWCLDKIPELKKRAYLANFLVKLNVPGEFLGDPQLSDLYSQYENLVEQFKETHKNYDNLSSNKHTTEDLRKDIENMEGEKEQISKRLERLKKKVEKVNNANSMLEISRNYRMETDREGKIVQQKAELHNLNVQLEQKIDRLESNLKELQNAYHDVNAETIIQKMEEENKVNAYMVHKKFPKEINMYKQKLKDYESIIAKSTMTQNDLSEMKNKLDDANREVQQLIEKRDLTRDPIDDKLTMFRQQATIVSRKKDAGAEALNDLRAEYVEYERRLKEKRGGTGRGGGDGEILRGEELKRYVNKLRSKGTTYKKKRQEVTELQAEFTTLKRTEEIIKKKFESVKGLLTSEEKTALDEGFDKKKNKTVEETMSKKELKEKISKKKAELAPYVKELKALREVCDEIGVEYEQRKSKYDQINAGFESNRSALEQEVRGLANEYRVSEERFHKLNTNKLVLLAFEKRAQDEMKTYTSKNASEKSFRDLLLKRISEQESFGKSLKDKQKSVKDVSIDGTKQMKLWRDLLRQMELKRKINLGLSLDDMSAYNNVPTDFQH